MLSNLRKINLFERLNKSNISINFNIIKKNIIKLQNKILQIDKMYT